MYKMFVKTVAGIGVVFFLNTTDTKAQGPCNVSGFPSQVVQGDDWMFTNNEEHVINITELTY